eukprot:g1553.t1
MTGAAPSANVNDVGVSVPGPKARPPQSQGFFPPGSDSFAAIGESAETAEKLSGPKFPADPLKRPDSIPDPSRYRTQIDPQTLASRAARDREPGVVSVAATSNKSTPRARSASTARMMAAGRSSVAATPKSQGQPGAGGAARPEDGDYEDQQQAGKMNLNQFAQQLPALAALRQAAAGGGAAEGDEQEGEESGSPAGAGSASPFRAAGASMSSLASSSSLVSAFKKGESSAHLSLASAMAAKKAGKRIREKAKKLRDERLAKIEQLNPAANNLVKERRALRGRKDISRLQKIVVSRRFEAFVFIAIMTNCLFMALEYQLQGEDKTSFADFIMISDLLFLFIFCCELGLRCAAFGTTKTLFNVQYSLDVAVVGSGLLFEILLPLMTTGTLSDSSDKEASKNTGANVMRMLRVLRALRVLRLLTIFEQLWNVVQLFFFSLAPLMYTVVFIMIIIFLFAMFSIVIIGQNDDLVYIGSGRRGLSIQGLLEEGIHHNMGGGGGVLEDASPSEAETAFNDAKNLFSTTRDAILYLFQMMTLDGWTDMVAPLSQEHIWPYFYFLLFISVSALGLMNLVTVTVLETASTQAKRVGRDLEIDHRMAEIQDLLKFPGEDQVLTTKQYFCENWQKSLAFRNLFDRLHLKSNDAGAFFDAMDLDSSGELDPFEMSTTYMELTTSVLSSTASIALIRSAVLPEEKGRILRATMQQAQAARNAAENGFFTPLKKQESKQVEWMLKAREERAVTHGKLDVLLNEIAELRGEIAELKSSARAAVPDPMPLIGLKKDLHFM